VSFTQSSAKKTDMIKQAREIIEKYEEAFQKSFKLFNKI